MHSLASQVADLQQNGCRTLLMSCTVWPLFPYFIITNDWCGIIFGELPLGCVIAQVVGCWLFTIGARTSTDHMRFVMHDSGTGTGFSLSTSLFSCHCHSTNSLYIYLYMYHWCCI